MVDRGIFNKAGTLASLPFYVDPRMTSKSETEGQAKLLQPGFQPGHWDIICHSGRNFQDHVGNRRFRICIANHLQTYRNTKTRCEKSAVISGIASSIRETSIHDGGGGGFVRFDTKTQRWYQVSDKVVRDKVGQALRDALQTSSRRSGKRKKRSQTAVTNESLKQKGGEIKETELLDFPLLFSPLFDAQQVVWFKQPPAFRGTRGTTHKRPRTLISKPELFKPPSDALGDLLDRIFEDSESE